ncbi:MarR family transcriptional regulator [Fusibacter bizertensis]|jgi:Transcriptional regulators|uniref:MarR family transcriptional regulator n=1 Tax=Fusibacter bizertensis TaxID=1488331 RepID=A0ABT6ND18_9FIRM|nr:MarR family transcriptional regulator [Fusibacter bizertensis]MDH8678320.1 MarR family transcriptional regulator [Fusibacter bizertensis]
MDEFERSYEVIRRVKRIKESMHEGMSKLFKDANLTGPQGMVVGILMRFGSLKISDISQHMGLSMSTVSGILDRLERDDIILREKSDEDGRVILIRLTDTFKQSSAETFSRPGDIWGKSLNLATEEELQTILDALSILERLMQEAQEKRL